jgi:hypothetical protein
VRIDYTRLRSGDVFQQANFAFDCAKTVPERLHCTIAVPEFTGISFARRFIFSSASLFIWSFICE